LRGNKGDARARGVGRQGLARIKEKMMDMGVDAGVEQIFTKEFLLSSTTESSLSTGNILVLDGFLYDRGMVLGDFSNDTNVLEASEGVVY